MALYKDPDVLILDEATSALGEKEVKWLFEMMHKLTKEQGKGILFISHRMDELRQALPAEEQELPEQFWDACSDLHLMELEVMFQVTWTAAREI